MNRTTRMALLAVTTTALIGVGSPAFATGPGVAVPQPFYKNCKEVRDAGKAPILKGQAGYRAELDRDGDGKACDTGDGQVGHSPSCAKALTAFQDAEKKVEAARKAFEEAKADVKDTADKRTALDKAKAAVAAAIAEDNAAVPPLKEDSQKTKDAKAAEAVAQAALTKAENENLGEADRDGRKEDLEAAEANRDKLRRIADRVCKGDEGEPGEPGEKGDDGKDGSDGADGKDGDDSDKDGVDDSVDKDVSSGSYGQVGASDVPSGSLATGG